VKRWWRWRKELTTTALYCLGVFVWSAWSSNRIDTGMTVNFFIYMAVLFVMLMLSRLISDLVWGKE
jgi:hypothetical protein